MATDQTYQAQAVLAGILCVLALAGWYALHRRPGGARRARLRPAGDAVCGADPRGRSPVAGPWSGQGRAHGDGRGRVAGVGTDGSASADGLEGALGGGFDGGLGGGAGGRGTGVVRWWPLGGSVTRAGGGRVRPPRPGPELMLLLAGLVISQAASSPVPMFVAPLALPALRRWQRRRRVAAEARQRAEAVVDLCTALAAELRSGATPEQALHLVTARLGEDPAALRRLGREPVARLAAGRYGADVPAAFELLAELPGGQGATAVAACWKVTSDSGSGLAATMEQVAGALRAERALVEEIEGELAASRTTIAVLAVLPVVGLVLGGALGARPLDVLFHTLLGFACLLLGAAAEAAGLAWTGRIERNAHGGALGVPDRSAEASQAPRTAVRAWRRVSRRSAVDAVVPHGPVGVRGEGAGTATVPGALAPAGRRAGPGADREGGGWGCEISRSRPRAGLPDSVGCQVMTEAVRR